MTQDNKELRELEDRLKDCDLITFRVTKTKSYLWLPEDLEKALAQARQEGYNKGYADRGLEEAAEHGIDLDAFNRGKQEGRAKAIEEIERLKKENQTQRENLEVIMKLKDRLKEKNSK